MPALNKPALHKRKPAPQFLFKLRSFSFLSALPRSRCRAPPQQARAFFVQAPEALASAEARSSRQRAATRLASLASQRLGPLFVQARSFSFGGRKASQKRPSQPPRLCSSLICLSPELQLRLPSGFAEKRAAPALPGGIACRLLSRFSAALPAAISRALRGGFDCASGICSSSICVRKRA